MATLTDDERWAAWCADFDDVRHEMTALFHTRWMWRTITGLMASVDQDVLVQNYILRTYVATVCSAIRREVDQDPRTTSLARCLQQLVDCPHFATRSRYQDLVRSDPLGLTSRAFAGFDTFAPNGGEFVEPSVIQASLDRLQHAAAPIRKYTNKVLAHRERRGGTVNRVKVSFDEINHALDELGAVTKQYHLLRHPGNVLANLTPLADLDFLRMFDSAWRQPGFEPPDVLDA